MYDRQRYGQIIHAIVRPFNCDVREANTQSLAREYHVTIWTPKMGSEQPESLDVTSVPRAFLDRATTSESWQIQMWRFADALQSMLDPASEC